MEVGETGSLPAEIKLSDTIEGNVLSQKVSELEVDETKSIEKEVVNDKDEVKFDKNEAKFEEAQILCVNDETKSEEEGEVTSEQDEPKLDVAENKTKVNVAKSEVENSKLDDSKGSNKASVDLINGETATGIDINTGTEESDGEIVDSDVDDHQDLQPRVDYGGIEDVVRPELDQLDYDEDVDEGELRDEPEDIKKDDADVKKEEKEMSEGEIESSDGEIKSDGEEKKNVSNPPFNAEDYEEGEMVDPGGSSGTREICRFFERGNCTWGERCRFLHPGVNDKGGYDMFGSEKNPPFHPASGNLPPPHMHPGGLPMPPHFPPGMMRSPPAPETAWERGLRHAKEMRRRSMQRKVEEPDFMRKREVISLNEALNVDRDMDYIAQKPLVEEDRGFDPFNALDEDDRYAVPPPEEIKRFKRFEKVSHHREGGRSPNEKMMRRPGSPHGPPGYPMHREMHNRNRRSPPRHPGLAPPHPHERHQPPPMPHRDHRLPPHQGAPHPRQDYRDANGDRARHERDFRDRRTDEMRGRDYRGDHGRNPPDGRRGSPGRRDGGNRVAPVSSNDPHKKNHPARGDTWSDPWARGRQGGKGRGSRSGSESSGSSSSSSRSSYSSNSGSSYTSRSSSRSSFSSSYSSSDSSRSPSPKKSTKKLTKKKPVAGKVVQKGSVAKNSPKVGKAAAAVATKLSGGPKKTSDIVKAKLAKPPQAKQSVKQPATVVPKPSAKGKPPQRGRPTVKVTDKKKKVKKRTDSSSSSEFSHSSSSGSRSRSKGKASGSGSDSGSSSSSGSESFSSSSGSSSSDSSNEDTKKRKPTKKKIMTIKPTPASGMDKKSVGKVPVPSKPGKKNVKMTIIDKATAKPAAAAENRKRSAGSAVGPPAKKVSAIANRRVELLEQLKVVENAILKKRAKLT